MELPSNWFEVLLRLPDALKTDIVEMDENEWVEIKSAINQAIEQLKNFAFRKGNRSKMCLQLK